MFAFAGDRRHGRALDRGGPRGSPERFLRGGPIDVRPRWRRRHELRRNADYLGRCGESLRIKICRVV